MDRSTRYAPEARERVVRMAFENHGEHESQWAAIGLARAGSGPSAPAASMPPPAALEVSEQSETEQAVEHPREPVSERELAEVEAAYQEVPPPPFDLTRKVHIYSSNLRFVEVEVEGCQVESRRLPVPTEFRLLAEPDDGVNRRARASYLLVPEALGLSVSAVAAEGNELRDSLASKIGRFDGFLLRKHEKYFKQKVAELREQLDAAKKDLEAELQRGIDAAIETLVQALVPSVVRQPPRALTHLAEGGPVPVELATQYVRKALKSAAPKAADLISRIEIHANFKDVAIELLRDEDFVQEVAEALSGEHLGQLHAEFDAAPASTARFDRGVA